MKLTLEEMKIVRERAATWPKNDFSDWYDDSEDNDPRYRFDAEHG